ncbi:homoserine dehydrogenase [Sutcliffiella rhizosphaerae]|nr:homoserine dehydrogenase [Sutcliffiella rhizosphaerae]
MSSLNIALLGFGTVGKGVYHSIDSHQKRLQEIFQKEVKIVAILVKNLQKHNIPRKDIILTDNFEEILSIQDLDIVVDAIVGTEPGFTYLQKSLKRGCSVVTANKEMFSKHGKELLNLAGQNNVSIGYEATVAGGIPIIQTIRQLLQVNRIEKVEGILNGTSNFILTSMRKNKGTFEQNLIQAQKNGYAEADPTNDIEGFDAYYKGVILSELVYGEKPETTQADCRGISEITSEMIEEADRLDLKFKHIVTISKSDQQINCTVELALVTTEHPFYQVEGVQNAVSINTDLVGNVTLNGPGAGMFPTASAILEDIIQLDRKVAVSPCTRIVEPDYNTKTKWVLFYQGKSINLPSDTSLFHSPTSKIVIVETDDVSGIKELNPSINFFRLKGDYILSKEKVIV